MRLSFTQLCREGKAAYDIYQTMGLRDGARTLGMSQTVFWRRMHWWEDAIAHAALYGRTRPVRTRDRMPMRYSGPHGTWWAHHQSDRPRPGWEGETPGQLLDREYERHVARYPDYYASHPRKPPGRSWWPEPEPAETSQQPRQV